MSLGSVSITKIGISVASSVHRSLQRNSCSCSIVRPVASSRRSYLMLHDFCGESLLHLSPRDTLNGLREFVCVTIERRSAHYIYEKKWGICIVLDIFA
ncbi:hypothetical protein Plhal304r1_c067g0155251 [Plasmopara halstedii]